jgi:putative flavoprotein involved in K+ transport
MESFALALEQGDGAKVAELFGDDCYWRDLVSFTWNMTTVEGREEIAKLVDATCSHVQPQNFVVTDSSTTDGITDVWFIFETVVGRGSGLMRIKDGKGWTLLTALDELKGFEENRGDRRPRGADHGAVRNRLSWKETLERESQEMGGSEQPYVLVVGGGQGGIGLGARLRQLNIPFVVIDKHLRPGDQWRSRYKSLCLHDPVWYDHMPYIKFPENWPVFSPKDKLGDWLESYTKIMEIPYWSSTTCTRAAYDQATQKWTVEVVRDGEPITLHPTHLVLATGMSGKPSTPVFAGQDVFAGDQHHSSQHPGPDPFVGKKVVVIGSNNSAHDICGALWESGVDVTMIQRSSTHIVKSETLMDVGLGDLYSERAVASGMTTEKADTIFASIPYRLLPDFQIPLYDKMREIDADYYARLEKAGFLLDWGTDGSGLFVKYLRRGSGYYIDVGASELIASGDIKLVTGQLRELTESAIVMDDGTEVPADVVVYATGYGSMNGWAADLISQEVADKVGKVWGLGSDTPKDPGPWEGEERNMWKPTQQSALWFHGGNLHQSRYYSLFLALQLKARYEGLDTPVYRLAATHHKG